MQQIVFNATIYMDMPDNKRSVLELFNFKIDHVLLSSQKTISTHGFPGIPGSNGMPLMPGILGPHGLQGRNGAKGQTGDKGSQGMLGQKREKGNEGPLGNTGLP